MKFTLSTLASLTVLLCGLVLSACGGGGGGTGTGGGTTPPSGVDTPPPPPTTPIAAAQDVKTRIADGFTVQVTPYAMEGAAIPERFEFTVTDPSKVNSVKAYIGKDFDTAVEVTPTKSGDTWKVVVPSGTATGNSLLLKFALTNGDEFEPGLLDFTF
jgi:hypothetical protein